MLELYRESKERRTLRLIWIFVNLFIFRLLVGSPLRPFRIRLLRVFGADIDSSVEIYNSVKIFAPWNLSMGRGSCIGPFVEIYNKANVQIGENSVISQGTYICTASHSIKDRLLPLRLKAVTIGNYCWIAARVIITPGVNIGDGSVISIGSVLFESTEINSVYRGNPAVKISLRNFEN